MHDNLLCLEHRDHLSIFFHVILLAIQLFFLFGRNPGFVYQYGAGHVRDTALDIIRIVIVTVGIGSKIGVIRLQCSFIRVFDYDSFVKRSVSGIPFDLMEEEIIHVKNLSFYSSFYDQITALSETHSTKIVDASDATKTIMDRGIITKGGIYLITLAVQAAITNNFSVYGVRYFNSTYYVTQIFEGSSTQAPRISSTGVLGLNGYTPSNTTIWYSVKTLY
jgi:hypothetical protein